MNKKFSTLLLCLSFIGLAFSASAHEGGHEYRPWVVNAGPTFSQGARDARINHIDENQWYQLRTTVRNRHGRDSYGYLMQGRDEYTGEVYLYVAAEGDVNLLRSLWRIDYTKEDGVGGGKFSWINKETNLPISFDHTYSTTPDNLVPNMGSYVIESCSGEWEWYNNNSQTGKFDLIAPYQYVHNDYSTVMIMKVDYYGMVYSYKDKSSILLDNHSVKDRIGALKIQPVKASPIQLTPDDINSMIDFNMVSWEKNEAGFLFFKPNGNAMNRPEDRMTPKADVMKEADRYVAKYNDEVLYDIFEMAVLDLDGALNRAELRALREALKLAESEYRGALILEKMANFAWTAAHNNLASAKTAEADAQGYLDGLMEAIAAPLASAKADADAAYVKYGQLNDWEFLLVPYNFIGGYYAPEMHKAAYGSLKAAVDAAYIVYTDAVAAGDDLETIKAALAFEEAMDAFVRDGFQHISTSGWDALVRVAVNAAWDNFKEEYVDATDAFVAGDDAWLVLIEKAEKDLEKAQTRLTTAENLFAVADKALELAEEFTAGKLVALEAARDAMSTALHVWDATKYITRNEFLMLDYQGKDGGSLMVDTAFWQENQMPITNNLLISHKTMKATDHEAIKARYFFNVTYWPTQDSLVFEPLNASVISNRAYSNDTDWKDAYVGKHLIYGYDVNHDSDNNDVARQRAEFASNSWTAASDRAPVVLKLEYLDGGNCLTAGVANPEKDTYLKTRITFNNPYKYLKRVTLDEGLYFIEAVNKDKYVVANMEGTLMYDAPEDVIQNYNDMPATMFVVEKRGCKDADQVIIHNREYGDKTGYAFCGQWYEDEDGNYYTLNLYWDYEINDYDELSCADKYKFVKVEDKDALTSVHHGYRYLTPDDLKFNTWKFQHNNALHEQFLNLVDNDTYLGIDEKGSTSFELDTTYYAEYNDVTKKHGVPYAKNDFGYGAGVVSKVGDKEYKLPALHRHVYAIKVKDVNLEDNDSTYIALVKRAGLKTEYYEAMGIKDIRAGKGKMAMFYLKADQVKNIDDPDTDKYYVLVDTRFDNAFRHEDNGVRQGHVNIGNLRMGYVGLDNSAQERASAFALVKENRDYYFNKILKTGDFINIFNYKGTTPQYLFEDGNNQSNIVVNGTIDPNLNNNFGYLGITGGSVWPKGEESNTSFYVDFVGVSHDRMSQYMLGVAIDSIANGYWCKNNVHGYWSTLDEAKAKDKSHYIWYNGYTAGRFLVHLVDSVQYKDHSFHKPDMYKAQNYVRLGFVEGVHMVVEKADIEGWNKYYTNAPAIGEYFYVVNGGYTLKDLMTTDDGDVFDYIVPERLFDSKYTTRHEFKSGVHNNHSFSFRKTEDAPGAVLEDGFKLETKGEFSDIASFQGAWVKVLNNRVTSTIMVEKDGDHQFDTVLSSEQIGQGEVFWLKKTTDTPTSNEEATVANVKVIAGQGYVTILGAAGKKVAISNVLGQAVANGTIESDNYTIPVSSGVVIVAVNGEKAVKAVVK